MVIHLFEWISFYIVFPWLVLRLIRKLENGEKHASNKIDQYLNAKCKWQNADILLGI